MSDGTPNFRRRGGPRDSRDPKLSRDPAEGRDPFRIWLMVALISLLTLALLAGVADLVRSVR